MTYEEFMAKVRDRGEYIGIEEADGVTRTVLARLGQRLAGGEAKNLAAQLPVELQDVLLDIPATGQADARGIRQFLRLLAVELAATEETARWDASAVLSTVAEAVSGGQLNQILSQLPSEYALLFGKPDLA